MSMRWNAARFLAALATVTCTPLSAARLEQGHVRELPAVLHGTWEIGPEPCKLPGNEDSDTRIVIEGRKINGYEDWREVLSVEQVSIAPPAWKVKTREHYYEDVNDYDEMFSIPVHGQNEFVIVEQGRVLVYERCI